LWYSWLVLATYPDSVARLLWEVDSTAVNPVEHKDYVLERVMSRGGWEAMQWLRASYSREEIADFLQRKGQRLPPRELAYWALITGITPAIAMGGGRPAWAGP